LDLRRGKEQEAGGNCIMLNIIIYNSSPHTTRIRVMKSRRMRGAWYVACIEAMRNTYKSTAGKPKDEPTRR